MTRRHWHLIALLRSCGWLPLSKLATETGYGQRTIRRDLEALELAGVPILKDRDDGISYWRLMRGAPCPCCGHAPEYTRLARSVSQATEPPPSINAVDPHAQLPGTPPTRVTKSSSESL